MLNRMAGVLGLSAAALAVLTACGSGGYESVYEPARDASTEAISAEDDSSVRIDEQIIKTANISLEVANATDAVAEISSLTSNLGGFIQSQSIYSYDDDASGNVTARVPAAKLDVFLDSLAEIGEVLSRSVDAQDVTIEVVDLEARIGTLQESITRLRALQQDATSVADLVAVETELANRQAELESLQARRDYLSRQVDMSTVYISIDQRDVGPGVSPDFLGGLENGWNSFLALTAGLITALGFVIPYLVIGGAITLVVFLIIAISRSRRKDRQ